ncbi:MAG: T9SS type A sorting domain-containing protein [Bacteroidetes bacterium]|nr:T9SS type A sorting domain-containing protein [Bacteroidota bacterium]
MKRFSIMRFLGLTILAISLIGGLSAQQLSFNFDNQASKDGFRLTDSRASGVHISHSLTQMSLQDMETDKGSGQIISLNGIYLPNNAGAPNLPGNSRYIAVPNGATAKLIVHSFQQEVISNVDLLPAAPIQMDTDDSPADYSKDMSIYSKDGLYPAEPFLLSKVENIRGVDVVMLGITPFQYNPVTKKLIVFHHIELEVVFEGGSGTFGDNRLRSRWWDPILQDMVINADVLPAIDYSQRQLNRETGAEYLIVIPDNEDFQSWADSIRMFRIHQGISTMIVNTTAMGGNTVAAFESYFNDAYNNWDVPPSAVLMLGDYNTNGSAGLISHMLNDHPGGYNPYISDNPFSDVSGNNLPDIVFARITATNEAQLDHMINKFLDYERNPPTNANFYDNPVTAMGWQTERWFQLCSEIVNGFWEYGLGKNPIRENAIYSGSPGGAWSSNANTSQVVNYFGPMGLNYIPANTSHLTDWGGNATRINNDINNGAFMLQHRDHGYELGWGEPDYNNSHLNGLTNEDLTFVWSVNCLTGKFNYGSESFTEKFHRHDYGAVGIVAATEVSYSFVNDVYVWGAFDNMWPEFMPEYGSSFPQRSIVPAFANAAGKIFLQQSSWPYNPQHKPITYNLFHHHGDAFLNIYSEIPQDLAVNHMPVLLSGLDNFEVTVEEGAWIALTNGDQIIGTAEAVAGTTQVPIEVQELGSQIRVTITKQNYYRYETLIDCIPPDGAYVIFNENIVNDENGNANGVIDFGETIVLDMALKNVGNENAEAVSVSISTESPYVTIVQEMYDYGMIEAGAVVMMENAFEFEVADDIPNNTSLSFELIMTSGDESWTSSFGLTAYAPDFNIGNYTVDDSQGNNNGRLDPGETATLIFSMENKGACSSNASLASLTMTNPFVELIDNEVYFETIEAGNMVEAQFEVFVNPASPIGVVADFSLLLVSGAYEAEKSFTTKIGLIVEDFESGDFESFPWAFSGNLPWTLTESGAYEGQYSAKSGLIGDSQSSQIMVGYEAGSNDTISFYYKVSSESSYDFLKFFIDGSKVGEWSGNVSWTKAAYAVEEGVHQFRWEYSKDGSVSNGEDCAWIDFVVLPPEITTMAWAGYDLESCESNPVQLTGYAAYYETLLWETSGDGNFDDPTILNPVYIAGETDIENGTVMLSLTAEGETDPMTDTMELMLYRNPQLVYETEAAICSGENYIFTTGEAFDYESLLWTSSGDGTFDDESALLPVYIPGDGDIDAGTVTLSLTAAASGSCEGTSIDFTLLIHALPTASISGDQTICEGDEAIVEISLTGQSPWMVMMEDLIDPMEIETELYQMSMTPEAPVSMTLTSVADGNGCFNIAEGTVTIAMDYPPATPTAPTGDTSLDLNEITESAYEITPVPDAETYSWELLPEEAGQLNPNSTTAQVIWNTDYRGDVSLKTRAENYCGESSWSEELVIELFSTIGLDAFANGQLKVYPNPASNILNLEIKDGSEGKAKISLVNILSEIVWIKEVNVDHVQTLQISLSGIPNGAYMLRYETKSGLSSIPILIKN